MNPVRAVNGLRLLVQAAAVAGFLITSFCGLPAQAAASPDSVPGSRILDSIAGVDASGQRKEVVHWVDPREPRFEKKRLERRVVTVPNGSQRKVESAMLADRLLVEVLSEDNRLSEAIEGMGLLVEDRVSFSPVFRVRLPDDTIAGYARTLGRLRALGRSGGFRVSPDYLTRSAAVPNDPDYAVSQADLDLIGAPAAWDIVTGASEVVVAIIDNGIDADHPDLADNLFMNPLEVPDNGIDDDGNGLVDDAAGWDFHDNDNLPEAASEHGTAMAGIIGAVGNNATGITGINWNCRMMMLKAGAFELPWSTIIQAIDYVILMRQSGVPVTVINNSYGGPIEDSAELLSLEAAVQRAQEAGLLFVAAAGNNGLDNDSPSNPHFYPSDLTLSSVFSVAATNNSDDLAGLSNYGTDSVDLAAPGIGIFTTFPGGAYGLVNGTSASCARVSGLAALLLAWNPHLDALQLKEIIVSSGDTILDLVGSLLNPVRIDAGEAAALARLYPRVAWMDGDGLLAGQEGDGFLLEADATDFDGLIDSVTFYADGALLGTDSDGNDGWSWYWANPAGEGILQVEVIDNDGRSVITPGRPFEVLSLIDYWRYGYWGESFRNLAEAGLTADPDRDGVVNLWEYAVGGLPLQASHSAEQLGRPKPVMFIEDGNALLGFDLRMRTDNPLLELVLESGHATLQGNWAAVLHDYLDSVADPGFPGFVQVRIGRIVTPQTEPAFLRLRLRVN
jgi:hypothetical protein